MVTFVHIHDPFNPTAKKVYTRPAGITIRGFLESQWYGFKEFEYPTICLINNDKNNAILRKDWDTYIPKDGDIVTFESILGWESIIYYLIVAIAFAVIAYVLMPKPAMPTDLGQTDSQYTLRGQRNQLKLGEPIEDNYGRVKAYPSYAARPYNKYINNDQYQYNLFCIGQGFYDIEGVFIENTPIENFPDIYYEIYEPGDLFNLFPDNVITADAISEIQLFAPNEEDYSDWAGPYTLNPTATEAYLIEVDMTIPRGLYLTDSKGNLQSLNVNFQIQLRQIDGSGSPVGDWFDVYANTSMRRVTVNTNIKKNVRLKKPHWSATSVNNSINSDQPPGTIQYVYSDSINDPNPDAHAIGVTQTISEWYVQNGITLKTINPQRITYEFPVTPGRYELRARRTSDVSDLDKKSKGQLQDQINLGAVRAFLPDTKDYGDVTLLAVRAKATNNLNDQSNQRFNVVCTRKLPIYDHETGIWSDELEVPEYHATRSIVWAFCNVFRAKYNGDSENDVLNMDELMELHEFYEANEYYFDFRFDQASNVWDMAKTVARAGRAFPIPDGSQVTMVRDEPKTVPTLCWSAHNIVEGSFKSSADLWHEMEYDGIEIEYFDNDTMKTETVPCLEGDDTGDTLEKVVVPGITNRDKAYEEGMYLRRRQKKIREKYNWQSEMEGVIPRPGDLNILNHPKVRVGISGLVESVVGNIITLDREVEFTEESGEINVICFRKRDGSFYGPFQCNAVEDNPYQVETISLVDTNQIFIPSSNPQYEPAYFYFGVPTAFAKLVKITSIQPGDNKVEIQAEEYDETVFDPSELVPPMPIINTPESPPALPQVDNVEARVIPTVSSTAIITWRSVEGALYYSVQYSTDGDSWFNIGQSSINSIEFPFNPGEYRIRVAAVNTGQGQWSEPWIGLLGEGIAAEDFSVTPIFPWLVRFEWVPDEVYSNTEIEMLQPTNLEIGFIVADSSGIGTGETEITVNYGSSAYADMKEYLNIENEVYLDVSAEGMLVTGYVLNDSLEQITYTVVRGSFNSTPIAHFDDDQVNTYICADSGAETIFSGSSNIYTYEIPVNNEYIFRIWTVDGLGRRTQKGIPLAYTPAVPGAVTDVSATQVGTTKDVTVSWTNPPDAPAWEYITVRFFLPGPVLAAKRDIYDLSESVVVTVPDYDEYEVIVAGAHRLSVSTLFGSDTVDVVAPM